MTYAEYEAERRRREEAQAEIVLQGLLRTSLQLELLSRWLGERGNTFRDPEDVRLTAQLLIAGAIGSLMGLDHRLRASDGDALVATMPTNALVAKLTAMRVNLDRKISNWAATADHQTQG